MRSASLVVGCRPVVKGCMLYLARKQFTRGEPMWEEKAGSCHPFYQTNASKKTSPICTKTVLIWGVLWVA